MFQFFVLLISWRRISYIYVQVLRGTRNDCSPVRPIIAQASYGTKNPLGSNTTAQSKGQPLPAHPLIGSHLRASSNISFNCTHPKAAVVMPPLSEQSAFARFRMGPQHNNKPLAPCNVSTHHLIENPDLLTSSWLRLYMCRLVLTRGLITCRDPRNSVESTDLILLGGMMSIISFTHSCFIFVRSACY